MTPLFIQRRECLLTGLGLLTMPIASIALQEPTTKKGPNLPDGSQAKGMMTPQLDKAVEKGL